MGWWIFFLAWIGYLVAMRARRRARAKAAVCAGGVDPVPARRRALVVDEERGPASAAAGSRTERLAVDESISVVLRRQVPVRFDELPRSWLGGLPMMPADVEWPTTRLSDAPEDPQVPMNFAAQICCDDLPPGLWGGLGPRQGWLLLFLCDANWENDRADAARVIHIDALGPERPPPPGLRPVHDLDLAGPDYRFVRGQADVPTVWRRWPVDIVPVPNRLHQTAGRGRSVIPDGFAHLLYAGLPVAKEERRLEAPPIPPFTWRGALYVVDSALRSLGTGDSERMRDDSDIYGAPGWVDGTKAKLADWLARSADREVHRAAAPAPTDPDERANLGEQAARRRDFAAEIEAALAFLEDDAPIAERLRRSHEDYLTWRAAGRQLLETIREDIVARDPDTPLPASDWAAIRERLEAHTVEQWSINYVTSEIRAPRRRKMTLVALAAAGLDAARIEIAADLYPRSAQARSSVPAELVASLEPQWRQLYNGLPHRMGGMHDGIQSDPIEGPAGEILLFQIVSDNAMNWCWGDSGAYYVFLPAADLKRHAFQNARTQLECC